MPGKHVRFAKTNTLHTISSPSIPRPPPLTYDNYSPASSNSLPTPPDFYTPLPPARKHSLPPPRASVVRLHPLLEDSSRPEIIYDVRNPPSTIGARTHTISPGELNEPATYPQMPSLTIIHKYLPWIIHITGSGYSRSRRMSYVTVWDVLKTVHASLRANVSQTEYDRAGRSGSYQERVRRAYEARYRSIRDRSANKEEKMGGVRRVDFLVEYVRFIGLVPHNLEKGEFMLHTEN